MNGAICPARDRRQALHRPQLDSRQCVRATRPLKRPADVRRRLPVVAAIPISFAVHRAFSTAASQIARKKICSPDIVHLRTLATHAQGRGRKHGSSVLSVAPHSLITASIHVLFAPRTRTAFTCSVRQALRSLCRQRREPTIELSDAELDPDFFSSKAMNDPQRPAITADLSGLLTTTAVSPGTRAKSYSREVWVAVFPRRKAVVSYAAHQN